MCLGGGQLFDAAEAFGGEGGDLRAVLLFDAQPGGAQAVRGWIGGHQAAIGARAAAIVLETDLTLTVDTRAEGAGFGGGPAYVLRVAGCASWPAEQRFRSGRALGGWHHAGRDARQIAIDAVRGIGEVVLQTALVEFGAVVRRDAPLQHAGVTAVGAVCKTNRARRQAAREQTANFQCIIRNA